MKISEEIWNDLSLNAWKVRENAFLVGETKVGAALYSKSNAIYVGCNIEHTFRSHDIHAEVNAISNMVGQGEHTFKAILVVAIRHRFTPCGSCMDWIMQHGGEDCIVGYQNEKGGTIHKFKARELMPHYPF